RIGSDTRIGGRDLPQPVEISLRRTVVAALARQHTGLVQRIRLARIERQDLVDHLSGEIVALLDAPEIRPLQQNLGARVHGERGTARSRDREQQPESEGARRRLHLGTSCSCSTGPRTGPSSPTVIADPGVVAVTVVQGVIGAGAAAAEETAGGGATGAGEAAGALTSDGGTISLGVIVAAGASTGAVV